MALYPEPDGSLTTPLDPPCRISRAPRSLPRSAMSAVWAVSYRPSEIPQPDSALGGAIAAGLLPLHTVVVRSAGTSLPSGALAIEATAESWAGGGRSRAEVSI